MSRKIDFEQSIRESYAIIREYEAIIRASDRQEDDSPCLVAIGEQWTLV